MLQTFYPYAELAMCMKQSKGIVWLRNDLRLDDHAPLTEALATHKQVFLVYIFNPKHYSRTEFGWSKTGSFRTQFLREALADFKVQAKGLGGDLIVRTGKPHDVLVDLAKNLNAFHVYTTGYATPEELTEEREVQNALLSVDGVLHLHDGHSLCAERDLPFSVADLPDVFTHFRKSVEANARIALPLPKPSYLSPLPIEVEAGRIPTLEDLGLGPVSTSPLADFYVRGGELAAQKHWHGYLENRLLSTYKETRNGLLGMTYSSKLSAWLALGCISPRRIYDGIKKYEAHIGANESTYWLIFELLWRDYFYFVARKFGSRLFRRGGIRLNGDEGLKRDEHIRQKWVTGKTCIPFIDANMRQLATTGFMSNRGRQNVASYWVKDLKQDWIIGASYFEHILIDYDPASNWGNWCYVAGVGNDPRTDRYFNIAKQAKDYDPEGVFIRYYVPEVAKLPASALTQPYKP